jgi:predicted lysophospholipase L1 biosynthesis ABC-type transport system permease subunit
MTPQQSRSVVITQSLVYAVTGLLAGIPIGLAVGRASWRIVAGIMPLRYEPPTAHWALLLVVPAALLAAVALGAAPGRRAARLPLADVLRTE